MGVYFAAGSLCNSGCLPALMIFKITPYESSSGSSVVMGYKLILRGASNLDCWTFPDENTLCTIPVLIEFRYRGSV